MTSRIAARYVSRRLSSSGKIFSEEEKAAENIYIKVHLFVATPSNIPAQSFEVYGVALVAQAFLGKKPHLIRDADNLFQQLQQTKVTALGNSIYVPTVLRYLERLERVGGSPLAAAAAIARIVVGVVVGILTLAGLKFLPYRNISIVSHVEKGSAMASDVINLGSSTGENLEAMPRMDVRLAEGVVRKWQNIKSQALGCNHCFESLSEVLDGQMLKIWADRAREIANHGWSWDYSLSNLNIDSVTISLDGRRAIVEAILEESA